jgi:CDP-diacylglycerol--glycerol-3-phosphate 3-phosphatidyltransferase
VPNVLTTVRLILAVVVFVLVPLQLYQAAFVVFVLAASTDWVDGYWARRFNQITQVGRIYDPFVDKIIVCGTFIFLAAEKDSGIAAWMAVVVVAREMLVTALRSYIERVGGDFSAKMSGKLKMVFQCVAAGASLAVLHCGGKAAPAWMQWVLLASVWLTVISTVYSGAVYVGDAAKLLLAANEDGRKAS